MSRGPGKIERAVETVFDTEPDNAFTTEDLCDRVYLGVNRIERKHRVSVVRAAKKVCGRRDDWQLRTGDKLGGVLVFFCRYSLMSYAMARMKSEHHYRCNDDRVPDWWKDKDSEQSMHARLVPGGDHRRLVVEGGAWWRHVQGYIAERDGDHERVEALERENDEAIARSLSDLGVKPAA